MMTRASRVLKWIGAGAVLLGAAPIAYADGSHSAPPDRHSQSSRHSARCGGEPADYVGAFALARSPEGAFSFDASSMTVTASAFGVARSTGSRAAGGGELFWRTGAVTSRAQPADVVCSDPAEPGSVTGITVHASNGDSFEIHRI